MRAAKSIAGDVDRGLAIVQSMLALKGELAEIEERLIADALARPDEHRALADAEREGRQWIAQGSECALPIVFTADKLVKEFVAEGAVAKRIGDAVAYPLFDTFFAKVISYEAKVKDGKKFRALAAEVLGEAAPGFIAACRVVDKFGIPKSDQKIEWNAAAAAAKLAEVPA